MNPVSGILIFSSFIFGGPAFTQTADNPANSMPWQGKKAAVVLTYDDAINQQLDHAVPVLDSLNLKATFYISPYLNGFEQRIDDWRQTAINGHELGNHTLFHPCDGSLPGREWVNANYDLNTYSLKRMLDEIHITSVLLETLDGRKQRTYAYTCGDMKSGDVLFSDSLKQDFVAMRAVRSEMHALQEVDIYNLDSYMISGQSAQEMINLVKQAKEKNALLVFLFHGVGGGHGLNVSLKAHSKLLHYLKAHESDIWTTTLLQVAKHVKNQQTL